MSVKSGSLRGLESYNDLVYVPTLIIFPQPRVTFDEIDELSSSIDANGLLNPILVAEYERKEFENHLEIVNDCWLTNFKSEDFLPNAGTNERPLFRVLVAGERRVRAIKKLDENPLLLEGSPARVVYGTNLFRIFDLQFVENNHKQPPKHEEAIALANYFRVRKKDDASLTKAEFARKVGCSPQTILNALRFSALPDAIYKEVKEDKLNYGIAVELARLQEEGLEEEDLKHWMLKALLHRKTVEEFHVQISAYINHRKSGQASFFEMTSEEASDSRRRTVEKEGLQYRWTMIHYNRRVAELFKRGLLGERESPYSKKSVVRTVNAQLAELKEVSEHIKRVISKNKAKEMDDEISAIENLLKSLIEH